MKHVFMMKHTKKHHDFEDVIHEVMKKRDYDIIYTASIQTSLHYMQRYKEKTRFYLVGGDGTVNGLIQALVDQDYECVIIPLGTGNDFCRMLTKEKDPKIVLEQSLNKTAQKVDTIQLNETYFINSACFGLDSVIANHVHDTPHIPLVPESKSYIVSILQHVLNYQYEEIKLMSEGQCLFEGEAILCTVNNGQYYGGGFHVIPHADIQDGLMDVFVVDRIPRRKIPYMLALLLKEKLYHRKDVHYFQLKEVDIVFSKNCNVDGEDMWFDHYHMTIHPASLNIVM